MGLIPVSSISGDPTIRHIPKFVGDIWYVCGTYGSDANTGVTPTAAFAADGKLEKRQVVVYYQPYDVGELHRLKADYTARLAEIDELLAKHAELTK